jgi:hypothetical protein
LAQDQVPQNVRGFLHDQIDSVVQVEVLLMLYARPGRDFAAADVASELRIEPAGAEAQLASLRGRGILANGAAGAYRWAPRSAELEAAVAGLAREYAERRVTVIGLIYAKPSDQLRSFADAFRIRKDKDPHG